MFNKAIFATAIATLSGVASAAPVLVPEIDGAIAPLALGLTLGLVALIRERKG